MTRYFKHFDWLLFGFTLFLSLIGLLFIFSATYKPEVTYSLFFKKQCIGLAVALCLYLIVSLIDYRIFMQLSWYGMVVVITLLLVTIVKGSIGMGAQRWINLFIFKLQPSELTKLVFPFFVTYCLFESHETRRSLYATFLPLISIIVATALLIVKQPDLGTALVFLFSMTLLLWCAGMPGKLFVYALLFLCASAPLSWRFLKPYQKKRVLVFLGYGSSRKERYHIEQSTIAIGSGGLLGKGFLQGTQNKLLFLPESRTDFIFSVIAEEMGFVGVVIVLLLYVLFLLNLLGIIAYYKDYYARLLALGIAIPIGLSAFINIGMVMGALPIVGIPLPLISYGLSNLWATYIGLGFISSITMHRSLVEV